MKNSISQRIEPLESRIVLAADGIGAGDDHADAVAPAPLQIFTVTTAADTVIAGDGFTSLREAIIAANSSSGFDMIAFDIPGTGVRTIALTSALPAIAEGVRIDGYTQPGSSPNTATVGNNATLLIALNGSSAGTADGLTITGTGSTVKGLAIHGFIGLSRSGILVSGATATDNVIEGCFLGTNAAGTAALANQIGITVTAGALNTTVRGSVISGNSSDGVRISNGATATKVLSNLIGTNAAGTAAVSNGEDGVSVFLNATSTTIGSGAAGEGNVLSGNNVSGLTFGTVNGGLVFGNFVGTNAAGTAPLGNGSHGIEIAGGSNILIGLSASGSRNVIAHNLATGIVLFPGSNAVSISANQIFNNGSLGIDLGGDGPTPNDTGDGDSGPNGLQNFPVLTSATFNGGNLAVQGTLNSRPSRQYLLEFFNGVADGSGFGEGQTFLDSRPVTTDASGNFAFSFPDLPAASGFLTATATELVAQTTSEFSAARTIVTLPTLSVSSPAVGEAGGFAIFTVSLSGASTGAVSVNLALANGTATGGGIDYGTTGAGNLQVSTSAGGPWADAGSATIPAGATSAFVRTPIVDDTLGELSETFTMTATRTAGTTSNPAATGTATITDNDTPALSVSGPAVGEAGGFAIFTVSLSGASTGAVSVNLALANGTATGGGIDYGTAGAGNLQVSTSAGGPWADAASATIAAGATSVFVRTPIVDDAVGELSETFTMTATRTAGATTNASASGTATILDNDTPTLSVSSPAVAEAGGFAIFTVSLSGASAGAVSVNLALANGTATGGGVDYGTTGAGNLQASASAGGPWADAASATIPAGATSVFARTPIVNDTLVENTETFTLTATRTAGITTNASAPGTATIFDNDAPLAQPALRIDSRTVNEGAGTVTFTVMLSAASAQTVNVSYTTINGTATAGADFTGVSGTLTFPPGATVRTVVVPILDDALVELTESFTVTLGSPVGATIAEGIGLGAILDNDTGTPPAVTLAINDVTVNEADGTATFTVTLSAASGLPVSVNYATGDGTAAAGADFTGVSGTLNFPAGVTTQTITVPIAAETIFEPDETFFVNLSTPAGAAIGDGQGQGRIVNDDALPTLSISDVPVTVAEGDAGTTQATFTVTLSNPSSQTVTVQYLSADGSATSSAVGNDFTAVALTTLTFAPGEVSKTIVIAVSGDAEVEPNEAFFLDFSAATNAALSTPRAQATIINDDLVVTPMPDGGSTVVVTDVDGDTVIVTSDQGVFIEDEFIFAPDGSLAMIDLGGNERFTGSNVTIRAEQAGGGDGRVKIGTLNAAGMDLKNVTVQGALGRIIVGDGDPSRPALKKLVVDSLGTALEVSEPLQSLVHGALGKLIVRGDVNQASFRVEGRIGSVSIGGSLLGKGGTGAPVVAALSGRGGLAALGLNAGVPEGIFGESIGGFTLEQNISNAAIAAAGTIDSVVVKGDVAAGAVIAAARIPVVKVLRNLASDDPANPVIIAVVARGAAHPAIDKLIVRGDVRNAQILLGYKSRLVDGGVPEGEPTILPKNADASVGKIKINGNWSASSLVAGVLDATGDGFGQNDTLFAGDRTPEIAARIASIVIKGTATGSVEEGDHFGISAQSIGKLSIGGESIALKKNQREVLLDVENGDFQAVEVVPSSPTGSGKRV